MQPLSATAKGVTKRIILCADDFALHAAVSDGIVQLIEQARLSATSVMVLSPRWPQDARRLQALRGQMDVGLHLDWTSPFARAAGHGVTLPAGLLQAALRGFSQTAARLVIARQLDAFEDHWQAPPDFVDGHQHIQQWDGIRQALVQVLSQRYQPAPYVRLSRTCAPAFEIKARVISAMGAAALTTLARQSGVPLTAALAGVYDFSGDEKTYGQRMHQWLAQVPDGGLIMCHPASAMPPGDQIGAARVQEHAYLRSAAFAQTLAQLGVCLVRGRATIAPIRALNLQSE